MRPINLIIPLLIISCTPTEKRQVYNREYNLLGEQMDDKGRVIKKAESGWIPGEDIWLRITRYDTLGNVIEEYGAKPYGIKYKDTFKYDDQNRIIEKCKYAFENEFENYGQKEGYELKDTLVDFSVKDKQLRYKVIYSFDIKNEITRERYYDIKLDSMTNERKSYLTFDTLYKLDNTDSLRTRTRL